MRVVAEAGVGAIVKEYQVCVQVSLWDAYHTGHLAGSSSSRQHWHTTVLCAQYTTVLCAQFHCCWAEQCGPGYTPLSAGVVKLSHDWLEYNPSTLFSACSWHEMKYRHMQRVCMCWASVYSLHATSRATGVGRHLSNSV